MEHCFSKVEDVNGDKEPLFHFFKFSYSCMRVCVCVYLFILFVFPSLLILTDSLSLLSSLFILF